MRLENLHFIYKSVSERDEYDPKSRNTFTIKKIWYKQLYVYYKKY